MSLPEDEDSVSINTEHKLQPLANTHVIVHKAVNAVEYPVPVSLIPKFIEDPYSKLE